MVEAGPDGGTTVVLVHGIGVSRRYFAPLVRELAGTARVLAVDLPGFGGNPGPRSMSIAQHAEAVRAALEDHGVRGAVVVGHSLGGQVVAHLVRAAPGLAAAAVLIGPTTDERARGALRQGLRLAWDSVHEPPAFVAVMVADYLRCGPRRYLATVPRMIEDRIERVLPDVGVPVLVLRGSRDPVAPARWTARLAAAAPDGRTAEVPGGWHGVQWSHPVEVARACLALARA